MHNDSSENEQMSQYLLNVAWHPSELLCYVACCVALLLILVTVIGGSGFDLETDVTDLLRDKLESLCHKCTTSMRKASLLVYQDM